MSVFVIFCLTGCQKLSTKNSAFQKGEYWVRQGQLARAQEYFKHAPQAQAHTYYQQIASLKRAQQHFNQGQFKLSQQQAQQVSHQGPTLFNIHKTARQLTKISRQAQRQKFLGPTVPTSLAQIDSTNIGQKINAGILLDQDSGQVIWQKQAQQTLPVASLSKLLAVYTIYQTLTARHIALNTKIEATSVIAGIENHSNLSTAKLIVGQKYSIEELLRATIVASANDAVMVLGQYLYGNQEQFVQQMVQNAKVLHLKNTQLVNANGLPIDIDPSIANNPQAKVLENQLSAQDLARVTQALLQRFPQVVKISQQKQIRIGNEDFVNTNEMLTQSRYMTDKYQVDGLKTGTGEAAGYGVIVTAKIQNRRVILVILKASSNTARFEQAQELLDYLAANWTVRREKLPTFPRSTWMEIWRNQNVHTPLQLQYQINLLDKPQQLDYSIWNQKQQIPVLPSNN